jgi:co-chaperonin GroES (HSP10)
MIGIIPFGERILVKRRKIGEKLGAGFLYASDETKDRPTDLADVLFVPDDTTSDREILGNADVIIKALTQKAIKGDSDALIAMLRLNDYVKIKSVKVGDAILLSKYVGIDFYGKETTEMLTLCNLSDVIGIVREK